MSGNYTDGDQIGSYSDPQFTALRQNCMHVQGAPTTALSWACFASRNTVLVNRVYVRCISSPSATAGTLCVHFTDTDATVTTLQAMTASAVSATWNTTFSFTAKTLATITQYLSLASTGGVDKGDWMVVYEYQVLPPATY